jgi:hypothetical protein
MFSDVIAIILGHWVVLQNIRSFFTPQERHKIVGRTCPHVLRKTPTPCKL